MALIATSVEQPGIARIFFDLQAEASVADEEKHIATAIAQAFAIAGAAHQAETARSERIV